MANVEELIKEGYDLDIISLELKIPMNTLMEIKQKLDEESLKRPENIEALRIMREKYNELFNKKYKVSKEKQNISHIRELTENEIKAFESAKKSLRDLAEEQKSTTSAKERRENISKANGVTKSVLSFPLNFEQLEELFDLYNVEEFSNYYLTRDYVKYSKNRYIKKSIVDKIAERIEIEMDLTDDWDELNELSKKNKIKYGVSQLSKLERVNMKLRMKMSSVYHNKIKEPEISPLIDGIDKGLARWKFKCRKCQRAY